MNININDSPKFGKGKEFLDTVCNSNEVKTNFNTDKTTYTLNDVD